jgi:predicted NAD/FAD-binding protein
VSGLTAAYVLSRSGDAVTLFEKDDRLGGHADTHDVVDRRGRAQRVDTGVIVHNDVTFPVLL